MSNQDILDNDIIQEFVDDVSNKLTRLETLIESFDSNLNDDDVVDEMFRLLHTIKGNASIFGFMKIKQLAHALEDLIDLIRGKKISVNDNVAHDLLLSIDSLQDLVTNLLKEKRESVEDDSYQVCLNKITTYMKVNNEQ